MSFIQNIDKITRLAELKFSSELLYRYLYRVRPRDQTSDAAAVHIHFYYNIIHNNNNIYIIYYNYKFPLRDPAVSTAAAERILYSFFFIKTFSLRPVVY